MSGKEPSERLLMDVGAEALPFGESHACSRPGFLSSGRPAPCLMGVIYHQGRKAEGQGCSFLSVDEMWVDVLDKIPMKCISIPWHPGASLHARPSMAFSLPESEAYSKESTLSGSEQSQADFRAPSAPSPSKYWPGHCPRLPALLGESEADTLGQG